MNQPLHLHYRPQTLTNLVGQPHIQTCLTNAIATDQIAPAYLFTGARGTGKTSTARILAKSLNCLSEESPTITPCGKCASCRAIESSSSLDVNEIDAASHGGVDDARELVKTVGLAPIQGRYRILIIDEFHMMTTQSQNALLKCIEEPPNQVVFILCTTEAHKVLPTIRSRCLAFEFRRVSQRTIKTYLELIAQAEQIQITSDGFTAIARLCDGGLRDALQLLAKAALLGGEVTAHQIYELAGSVGEAQLLGILQAIASQDVLKLLQTARTLVDSGKSPKQIQSTLLNAYRDLLILQQAPNHASLLTSPIATTNLTELAADWTPKQIQHGLTVLHEAESQLRFSPNDQTWLEVTLLNLVPQFSLKQPKSTPSSPATIRKATIAPTNGKAPTYLDPEMLWQTVLEQASEKAQTLLSQSAKLTSFDGKTAVLVIDPAKEAIIKRHAEKISRMIARAASIDASVKLRIQVPTSIR